MFIYVCAYIQLCVCMYVCICTYKVLLFPHITCSLFFLFLGKSAESTIEAAKEKPDDGTLVCGM